MIIHADTTTSKLARILDKDLGGGENAFQAFDSFLMNLKNEIRAWRLKILKNA